MIDKYLPVWKVNFWMQLIHDFTKIIYQYYWHDNTDFLQIANNPFSFMKTF